MAIRIGAGGGNYLHRTTGLLNYNAAYTWAGWFYRSANSGDYGHFIVLTNDSSGSIDHIGHSPATPPRFRLECAVGGSFSTVEDIADVPLGSWFHLCLRRNSTTSLQFLLNGAVVATNPTNVAGRSAIVRMVVGEAPEFGSYYLNGRFFGLKEWSAALTDAEVQAEMHSIRPIRLSGLNHWHPGFPGAAERVRSFASAAGNYSSAGTLTDEDPGPISYGAPILWVPEPPIATKELTLISGPHDFSAGIPADLTVHGGNWNVVSGVLEGGNGGGGSDNTNQIHFSSLPIIEGEIVVDVGPGDYLRGASTYQNIVFRRQSSGDRYIVSIWGSGGPTSFNLNFWKIEGGSLSSPIGGTETIALADDTKSYRVRVRLEGTSSVAATISVIELGAGSNLIKVNNVRKVDASPAAQLQGAGLWGLSYDQGGVTHKYDNLALYELEAIGGGGGEVESGSSSSSSSIAGTPTGTKAASSSSSSILAPSSSTSSSRASSGSAAGAGSSSAAPAGAKVASGSASSSLGLAGSVAGTREASGTSSSSIAITSSPIGSATGSASGTSSSTISSSSSSTGAKEASGTSASTAASTAAPIASKSASGSSSASIVPIAELSPGSAVDVRQGSTSSAISIASSPAAGARTSSGTSSSSIAPSSSSTAGARISVGDVVLILAPRAAIATGARASSGTSAAVLHLSASSSSVAGDIVPLQYLVVAVTIGRRLEAHAPIAKRLEAIVSI